MKCEAAAVSAPLLTVGALQYRAHLLSNPNLGVIDNCVAAANASVADRFRVGDLSVLATADEQTRPQVTAVL